VVDLVPRGFHAEGLVDAFRDSDACHGRRVLIPRALKAREVLPDSLRELGCEVHLDDFGSGYSSLSYVHRLPLDAIKIDRSFVLEVETSEVSRGIIRTIVDLCRNLKLQCVVEGVETAGQVAALRELGCDAMQGFYFSEPFAPDAMSRPVGREMAPAAG